MGQQLPDSITITKNTYVIRSWNDPIDQDSLYKTKTIIFRQSVDTYESTDNRVSNTLISDLLHELNDPDNLKNSLDRYEVDTTWIKNNPEKMLELSSYFREFAWNKPQKDLILKELVQVKYYEKKLANYLNEGCCYSMHQSYRYEYILRFYCKGSIVNQITSRKYVYGYMYPWTNTDGNKLYSFKIENILDILLNSQRKVKEPPRGKELLKILADYPIAINYQTLHRLAPYSYQKEIDELKSKFEVVSFTDMTGYGGYHGNPCIQVKLKSPEMLPNVYLEFLASKYGNTIYSRDSIVKDYKQIVSRVQSIKFIVDYLKANPNQKLDIFYFNNKPINSYNIDIVNKNSLGWAQHDKYIESLKWYQKNDIKPSFSLSEAIKTDASVNCGCNFRFDSEFIGNAISFEIYDENRNYSFWYLLPDNTVLLRQMGGKKVLNYDYTKFGEYPGMQSPCVLFDNSGKILPKKYQ
ncbi:MAG: hypothetical protein ACXVJB_10510 [Mucilaginibacter sp.]